MVVVAGEHDQRLLRPEHLADRGEERPGALDGVAVRGLAQLQPVAEDHQAVDVAQRVQQRLAQVGAPQQVGAPGLAEVQVGDHEGAHEIPLMYVRKRS